MKNILIIDGQGGRMGSLLVERLKERYRAGDTQTHITAIGTNSIATAAMLRAGADSCATGENPVAVNCQKADYIMGPIGIIAANSLLGEVTPAMALAVSSAPAEKILIPTNKCSLHIAGIHSQNMTQLIDDAVEYLCRR